MAAKGSCNQRLAAWWRGTLARVPVLSTAQPHDVAARLRRWREDTPATANVVHLNNAGAALMPQPVVAAITDHIALEARIGGYEAADAVASRVEQGYEDLAALVGTKARNIAVVENATVAVAQALSAFDFRPGDVIVTTNHDYTSNQLMYLALAQRQGVEVRRAADVPEGGVDPDSVRRHVRDPRVRLVALTWVPTNGGLIQPAEEVGAIAREAGIPYLLDACQAVGQLPVDAGRVGADFLAATARKFLRGPRGIGFLAVSDRMLGEGRYPLSIDMRGAGLAAADRFELMPDARRFENWEFPYALVLGQAAAARYALDVGIEVASARAQALATRVRDGLAAIPAARPVEPGRRLSAIVTSAFDGWPAEQLVLALRERGINTSASTSGPGPFNADGAPGESILRISPHYYNTEAEIDRALDELAAIVRRPPGA
jgi:selenocysteine lyase/cysteine desulfurase